MGIYPTGVQPESGNCEALPGSLLPSIGRQDGWDGEHSEAYVGAEGSTFSDKRSRGSLSIDGWRLSEMRTLNPSTRLEANRLRLAASNGRGHLISFYSLSEAEREYIQREVLKDVRVKGIDFTNPEDDLIFEKSYLTVLSQWGIMCPHPESCVDVDKHQVVSCRVCECVVFNTATAARLAINE